MLTMNLFSIFDPSTDLMFSMNWLSLLLMFLIIPQNYWLLPSRYIMFWLLLMYTIYKEFKLLMKTYNLPDLIIFISLLMMILLMNSMGLFPYIFTPTSHMVINLSMAFTLWMSFMIYGWLKNTMHMLIHTVPLNTPMPLMYFMVLIETISNIIRPWTLSIRLTANMLADHLLLTLLGSSMENSYFILIPLIVLIQNLLFILEISVASIQSYAFSILSLLYFNESTK